MRLLAHFRAPVPPDPPRPGRIVRRLPAFATALAAGGAGLAQAAAPDFGPNVRIFTPDMATADIQSAVDAVAAAQVPDTFGPGRVALLFMPGTHGCAAAPLNFQVGDDTSVAGLGRAPTDVTINGSINAYNPCDSSGSATAANPSTPVTVTSYPQ